MIDTTTQAGSPPDHADAAVGTSEATEQQFDHTEGGDHGEGEDGQPVETEEVELGGKKYVVPKEVARGILREADYTRKTQELAEKAKGLDTERSTHGERVKADAQLISDGRELVVLEWQIKELQGMDQASFRSLPPERQNELMYALARLQGEYQGKRNEYAQKIEARNSEAERARATRREHTLSEIAREVEGWSPQLQSTLETFAARELKLGPQQIAAAFEDPTAAKILHFAHLGHQSVAKAKAAAAQATTQPAPTRTVSGGGSAAPPGLSDRLSIEEWTKRRNAQLRKR